MLQQGGDVAIQVVTHPVFGVVTLALGVLIGHRLELGRDKRKEWNEYVAKPYLALQRQILSKGRTGPTHFNQGRIERDLLIWDRWRFRRVLRLYKAAVTEWRKPTEGVWGRVGFNPNAEDELVRQAIALRKFLEPR